MKGSARIYLFIGLAFIVVVVLLFVFVGSPEKVNPEKLKPIDWSETYHQTDRGPYGIYIFNEVVFDYYSNHGKGALSEKDLNESNMPERFGKLLSLKVHTDLESSDDELREDFRFVQNGNYLFLSGEKFSISFLEFLGYYYYQTSRYNKTIDLKFTHDPGKTKYRFNYFKKDKATERNWRSFVQNNITHEPDSTVNPLDSLLDEEEDLSYEEDSQYNVEQEEEEIEIDENFQPVYYEEFIGKTEVLQTSENNEATFIKINYGKGAFFIHTVPLAFTNFSLIHEKNIDHLDEILSLLPEAKLLTHELEPIRTSRNYSSDGSGNGGDKSRNSPLEVIFKIPSLRWAYYLSLITLLLFVLFRIKRKQRAIPAKEKNENSSIEFANTVSQVYFQSGKHLSIAIQKEKLFFSFIRERYFLNSQKADEAYIRTLSNKSGISEEKLNHIFKSLKALSTKTSMSDQEFIELHQTLEYFYKNCK